MDGVLGSYDNLVNSNFVEITNVISKSDNSLVVLAQQATIDKLLNCETYYNKGSVNLSSLADFELSELKNTFLESAKEQLCLDQDFADFLSVINATANSWSKDNGLVLSGGNNAKVTFDADIILNLDIRPRATINATTKPRTKEINIIGTETSSAALTIGKNESKKS